MRQNKPKNKTYKFKKISPRIENKPQKKNANNKYLNKKNLQKERENVLKNFRKDS